MITKRIPSAIGGLVGAESGSWTCASCRRATSLPSRTQTLPPNRLQHARRMHYVPRLAHDEIFARDGVPGLMSRDCFNLGWTNYMPQLISKLNLLTAGTPEEDMSPKDIVLRYARDPMAAALFNHASMAHNTDFFYRGLSTLPQELDHQQGLKASLERDFGSIETLKATMLDTAEAMFGPGFVWLVWARGTSGFGSSQKEGWRILNTYNAGTPYPEAGYRQQGVDMNNQRDVPQNDVGAFGASSAPARERNKIPPGGTALTPVLCVTTWEHAYLPDHGFNKRKFLNLWWKAIDWHTVYENAPTREAKGLETRNQFKSDYSR